MHINVDKKKCICCGACQVHCPAKAISLRDGSAVIDHDICVLCMICVPKCYMRAIYVEDEERSVAE